MQPRTSRWTIAALGVLAVACALPEPVGPTPVTFGERDLSDADLRLLNRAFLTVRPGALVIRRRFEVPQTDSTCPMPVSTVNSAVDMPTVRPWPLTAAPMPTDTTGCRNPLYRKPH